MTRLGIDAQNRQKIVFDDSKKPALLPAETHTMQLHFHPLTLNHSSQNDKKSINALHVGIYDQEGTL